MLQILLYMILQCCQKSQTILSAADTRNHKLRLVMLYNTLGHQKLPVLSVKAGALSRELKKTRELDAQIGDYS